MTQTILVVDDDPVQRRLLEAAINRAGMHAVAAPGGQPALDLIHGARGEQIKLVLLDLVMPDMDGLTVLSELRTTHPHLPVIALTAKGEVDSTVEAMQAGASDYLVKPASPERVIVSIRNALRMSTLSGEVMRLKKRGENRVGFEDLIGKSQEMRHVIRLCQRAAQSNGPILIEGEAGVGKELIARAIHGSSPRGGKPFVTLNCGAHPESRIDSILFGQEEDGAPGASDGSLGKFQEADGGTLFLSEIEKLPRAIHAKLLRTLQTGEIEPTNSTQPMKVDVRVLTATHYDLTELARKGEFDEDLHYRLNGFAIAVPPLRERRADILALAQHFIERFAAGESKTVTGLTQEAQAIVERFDWPGNVRQLETAIVRAILLSDTALLNISDFPQAADALGVDLTPRRPATGAHSLLRATHSSPIASAGAEPAPYGFSAIDPKGHMRKLEEMESEMIRLAISRYEGHMSEVARRLGIGRSTLYRKLKDFGLDQHIHEAEPAEHDVRQSAANG